MYLPIGNITTALQKTKFALKILVVIPSCCLVIGVLISLISVNNSSSNNRRHGMPGLRFLPWLEILDSGETIRVEHCV